MELPDSGPWKRIERIGNAVLLLGDCLEILPVLPKVDAVITDPPYGIGLENRDVDGHRGQWGAIPGDDSRDVGVKALSALNDGTRLVAAFSSPGKEWPGRWRNRIVWDKGGAVGGGGDIATCLKRSWELLQVFNPEPYAGARTESVWRHAITPSDTVDHICAKPVPLIERVIRVFSRTTDTVLDPFMGSGTTGIACSNLGRSFLGIEIEPKYFDIACERIENAQRQERLFA
jgi:DNA modification methylase